MFLDEILSYKRFEVDTAARNRPLADIVASLDHAPKVRGFAEALIRPNRSVGLIAEVKKASPSAGVIRGDFDHLQIAIEYTNAGADCISVLTDERFFQGSLRYLSEIREHVAIPLLRKDFIIDSYQIYEARAAGADAILLIVAALDFGSLKTFHALGRDLGMDVLVETHSIEEMRSAIKIGADLIGINSRNLKTFVTDLAVVRDVAVIAPKTAILVAESAIKTNADVRRVTDYGASTVLVGETLMRSSNIATAIDLLLT